MNTDTLREVIRETASVANACEADGGSQFLITYARKWNRELSAALADLPRGEGVAFRCRVKGHKEWTYIGHRSPDSFELRECEIEQLFTHPAQAPSVAWPEGLLERVKAAAQRIEDGHSIRRVPADPTDPDLLLSEVIAYLEGKEPPFWIKTASPTPPEAQEDE